MIQIIQYVLGRALKAKMPALDVNQNAKFVVLARTSHVLMSAGVESASKAVAKILEFEAAEMYEIEVIDYRGASYTRAQLDELALGEKRLV